MQRMIILDDSETESCDAGHAQDVQNLPRAREEAWLSYEMTMPAKPPSDRFFRGLIPVMGSFGGRPHQGKQSLVIADLMSSWREVQEKETWWNTVFDLNILETRPSCRKCEFVARCFAGDLWAAVAGGEISETEEQFNALAQRWYRETGMLSFINQKAMHPAYQRIIGMGRNALPFIFRELSENRGDWFWALESITDENPADGITNFRQASKAWLVWAQERGLFWI